MRLLLTGGSGFIGGAVALGCLHAGWDVTLLLRPGSAPPPGAMGHVHCVYADLGSATAGQLRAMLPACDVVIHAAAIRNRWGTPPEAYRRVNVDATRNLLQAVNGYAHRFVYISSVGVYGFPGLCGITERQPTLPTGGPLEYHTSKLEAEYALLESRAALEKIILRPTITYGPGDADGMVTRLIGMIQTGRVPMIGGGNNFLHLTFISDLVDAILAACTTGCSADPVYNVCGPEPVRFVDLVRGIAETMQIALTQVWIPKTAALWAGGLVECAYRLPALKAVLPPTPWITRQMVQMVSANRGFSAEKARAQLGYAPTVDLPQGLALTLEWMTRMQLPRPRLE
jgi:nucleoside-diphosphate-sugar epimerase